MVGVELSLARRAGCRWRQRRPARSGSEEQLLPRGQGRHLGVLHRGVRCPEVNRPLGDGGDAGAGAIRLIVDLDVAVQVAIRLEPAPDQRGRERGAGPWRVTAPAGGTGPARGAGAGGFRARRLLARRSSRLGGHGGRGHWARSTCRCSNRPRAQCWRARRARRCDGVWRRSLDGSSSCAHLGAVRQWGWGTHGR